MPLIRTASQDEVISSILAGNRGEIQFDYQLWQSDISGNKRYLIRSVESAEINLSNYRDHTWELAVNLLEDDEIDPFLDYVKVVIRIRSSDVGWIEFPMGLYRFDMPQGSDNPFFTTWDLVGRSLEAMLLDNMAAGGKKVNAGTGVLQATRQILTQQGIPADRINFPSPDVPLVREMTFSPFQDVDSCYWLRICNALLAAGGFYALYTDNEGYFTTKPIEGSGERPIAITYLGNGALGDREGEELITGDIGWEYDPEFWNKVVVYSDSGMFVVAVAQLHNQNVPPPNAYTYIVVDEESEYAYEALNNTFLQRPPESYQAIATSLEASKLAISLLKRSASKHVTLTVPTIPDPRRGPREDYWIEARRSDGERIWNGHFRVVGWSLPLSLSEMSHEVNKAIRG